MRFASVQKLRIIYCIVLYYVLSSGWVSYCITLYWWNPCRDRVISLSGQPSAACPAVQATLPPVSMPCNSSSRAQAQPAIERNWHTDSRVVLRAVNEPSQRFTVSFWRFRSLKLFVLQSIFEDKHPNFSSTCGLSLTALLVLCSCGGIL